MRQQVAEGGGCIACGAPVTFPEFTSLCNECEDANLYYANEVQPYLPILKGNA